MTHNCDKWRSRDIDTHDSCGPTLIQIVYGQALDGKISIDMDLWRKFPLESYKVKCLRLVVYDVKTFHPISASDKIILLEGVQNDSLPLEWAMKKYLPLRRANIISIPLEKDLEMENLWNIT